MPELGGPLHGRLVDLDAHPRPRVAGRPSAGEGERAGVEEVVQDVVVLVVVDADALFLDEEVGDGEGELQAGGRRDGAERALDKPRSLILR